MDVLYIELSDGLKVGQAPPLTICAESRLFDYQVNQLAL